MKNAISVLITTYLPKKYNYECIAKICKQFPNVIIYDNSVSNNVKKKLLLLQSEYSHLEIFFNSKNMGIATALNKGVEKLKNNFAWILFFDQDTLIANNLNLIVKKFIHNNEFDILGLNYKSDDKDFIDIGSIFIPAKRTIISGMLVNSFVFNAIRFRDDFFLDMVDHDFCYRAKNSGLTILKTKSAFIKHKIGNIKENRFLFIKKKRLNHNNFRYYIIARNKILFDKLNENHLRIKTLYKLIFEFFLIIFFDRQVLKKLKAHFFGILHGLTNKHIDLPLIIKRFEL
jgi:rhamnosyltransferase